MSLNTPEENPKEPKKLKPLPVLTQEQIDFIKLNWTMDIRELTRIVFKNPDLDGRSVECKAVKIQLSLIGKGDAPKVPEEDKIRAEVDFAGLSEAQRDYVKNNMEVSSDLEMARILFGEAHLPIGSPECRMITAYCRYIDPNYKKNEELVTDDYKIPKSIDELIVRVNRYAINPKKDGKPIYDAKNLSNNDKKQLQALLSYMQLTLFKIEASKYERKNDRELFESTFISVCWDKPDLLTEEVLQYVAFSGETVKYTQIERTVNKLDARLHAMLETEGSIKQPEVELLNSVREKSNVSMKQSAQLLKTLVGDRSKRLNDKIQSNASMHNLVQMWKREEDRRKIIAMNQKKEKAALRLEIERLSDMDALKAEIFGLDKDDIMS